MDSHAVVKTTAKSGSPVTVWTASGWSHGGVESPQAWTALVQDFAYAKAHPLKVEISRQSVHYRTIICQYVSRLILADYLLPLPATDGSLSLTAGSYADIPDYYGHRSRYIENKTKKEKEI